MWWSFIISLFLAIICGNIQVMIFRIVIDICVEFSLKIVYNKIGYLNQVECVFIFCSSVVKRGYSA